VSYINSNILEMPDLHNLLEAAEHRLANLRLELSRVEQQVALEDERVALLRRLLELETGGEPRMPVASALVASNAPRSKPNGRPRLEDAVVAILADSREPVHIGQIRSRLVEQGIRIPGKGTDSNIIARIIKEPRIERQAGRRGYYRLTQA
jgi:hypothetical protein